MPHTQLLKDWFFAFLAGTGLGAAFLLAELFVGSLPGRVTWDDLVLFCVMVGLGFAFAATSLVWWEEQKERMSLETLTSTSWLIGEWIATTLWTVVVLSFSMSAAAFFYSGDWPVLIMAAIFTPLSALLAVVFVWRDRKREGEGRKET